MLLIIKITDYVLLVVLLGAPVLQKKKLISSPVPECNSLHFDVVVLVAVSLGVVNLEENIVFELFFYHFCLRINIFFKRELISQFFWHFL